MFAGWRCEGPCQHRQALQTKWTLISAPVLRGAPGQVWAPGGTAGGAGSPSGRGVGLQVAMLTTRPFLITRPRPPRPSTPAAVSLLKGKQAGKRNPLSEMPVGFVRSSAELPKGLRRRWYFPGPTLAPVPPRRVVRPLPGKWLPCGRGCFGLAWFPWHVPVPQKRKRLREAGQEGRARTETWAGLGLCPGSAGPSYLAICFAPLPRNPGNPLLLLMIIPFAHPPGRFHRVTGQLFIAAPSRDGAAAERLPVCRGLSDVGALNFKLGHVCGQPFSDIRKLRPKGLCALESW